MVDCECSSTKEALGVTHPLRTKRPAMPHLLNTDGRLLPNYQRTRNWLMDYISEQKLESGDKLPSERDLADALALSRSTVARAISDLIADGVLVRKHRVGTYVGGIASSQPPTRTGTIGVIMPCISQDGVQGEQTGSDNTLSSVARHTSMSSQILPGIIPILKEADYRLVLHSNPSLPDEINLLRNLPNEGLDGAIIMPTCLTGTESMYAELAKSGLPIVFVDRYFPDCRMDRVVTDNITGAKKAVEHLIGLGHTRIAHFTNFIIDLTSVTDRQLGYQAALENAGIEYDEDLVCGPQLTQQKQWDFRYVLEHCLRLPNPITAVFCVNDSAITTTLQAANKLGVRVPEDLTVLGFSEFSMPAGIKLPYIRVVQNKTEIGRVAAKLLIDRISGDKSESPRHVLIPAELKPSYIT